MEETIAKVTMAEAQEALAIYESLKGSPGCTWDEYYPALEHVQADIRAGALYGLYERGRLAAVAAMQRDAELDGLPCWDSEAVNPCELSRVGVIGECGGRGLAARLIAHAETDAQAQGFDSVRLLVGKRNSRAIGLYGKLGYAPCGEAWMYEQEWLCYQKRLG